MGDSGRTECGSRGLGGLYEQTGPRLMPHVESASLESLVSMCQDAVRSFQI